MRSVVVGFVLMAILLGDSASGATALRTEKRSYAYEQRASLDAYTADCGAGTIVRRAGAGMSGGAGYPSVHFVPRTGDASVTITIADRLKGQATIAIVHSAGTRTAICGATTHRIAVRRGYVVTVTLRPGASERGASVLTNGIVRATFHR